MSADETREVAVTRTDFKRRSRVHLSCSKCGGTTVHVPMSEADIYEDGFREHLCGVMTPLDMGERPAFRRLLLHTLEGAFKDA
jgi:hypothetical protein